MKTYLFIVVFSTSVLNLSAQYATRSAIAFNPIRGFTAEVQNQLDSVYHSMNNLNYHCFDLITPDEQSLYTQHKLVTLTKARASKIVSYYQNEQDVENENVFIKYDGTLPTLWLHKPTAELRASGKITLSPENQQCFAFNPSTDEVITSKNGNRYYFPSSAFETLNGQNITTETITICVWEFMDKKDLIYSGLTTDANGKMLETAGSYYIEAKLNGKELRLRQGESYTVELVAAKSFPDMFTYYGGNKDDLIDWEVNKNERALYNAAAGTNPAPIIIEPIQVNEKMEEQLYNINSDKAMLEYDDEYGNRNLAMEESVEAVDFYELSAGKLGWINCDRFYEVKNTTTLAVRVDSDSGMVVRLVFRDINSVMPCYANSNHKDQYQATGLPVGEKVLLLAYSVKDENAVLGYKEITLGENEMESISLNQLSKTRFKSAVSELLSF